jgi:hypothetical protein
MAGICSYEDKVKFSNARCYVFACRFHNGDFFDDIHGFCKSGCNPRFMPDVHFQLLHSFGEDLFVVMLRQ